MDADSVNRDDLLVLLGCMGVKFPRGTKLPDNDLNKRLPQAIDGTQRFTDMFGSEVSLNPSNLPKWTSSKPLVDAVNRTNIEEAYENSIRGRLQPVSMAIEDTFREVRQILLGFSVHWEQGRKVFVLMDTNQQWCIVVRIIEVHRLEQDPEVPVFSILYKVVHRPSDMTLKDHLGQSLSVSSAVSISTTELERKYILKVLATNSKRLSPNYAPQRKKTESSYKLSFILPLAPLNARDLGKLTNNPGCDICGKRGTSRCKQCLTASYCGTECQKIDWNEHKKRCRALKGGVWHTITCSRYTTPSGTNAYQSLFNRLDTPFDMRKRQIDEPNAPPPPNIHGDKAFLVKLQINQFGGDTSIMLYDRQRSFQVHWRKSEDREVFTEGERAMQGRAKIYRWARRVGDNQFSVCFDRAPETDPVW